MALGHVILLRCLAYVGVSDCYVALQALKDGSLMVLCSRMPGQPHIASAYAKHAPMRRHQASDLKAALLPLQVVMLADSTNRCC